VDLKARRARAGKLAQADVDALRKDLIEPLSSWIDSTAPYPKFYSLRADLTDLIPSQARTEPEVVRSQNDRLRYETALDLIRELRDRPTTSDPLSEDAAYTTLARYRPAISVNDGKLIGKLDPEWSRVLGYQRSADAISNATKATGLFRIS